MAITGVFFCFIVAEDPLKRMATIRHAYVIAAVIGAITGIIGYFGYFGMGAAWAPVWRAQGTFKDPNVLSTFLIPAFIFLAEDQQIFEIRASLAQSYDVGETGRFGNQIASIPMILTEPNGMSPRHFHFVFGADPHNVYLNAFASYGWLGGISFVTLVITSFWA